MQITPSILNNLENILLLEKGWLWGEGEEISFKKEKVVEVLHYLEPQSDIYEYPTVEGSLVIEWDYPNITGLEQPQISFILEFNNKSTVFTSFIFYMQEDILQRSIYRSYTFPKLPNLSQKHIIEINNLIDKHIKLL